MQNFFDPNEQSTMLIPMYGRIHLIVLFIVLTLIPILVWQRERVKRLSNNRTFINTLVFIFLSIELLYWIMVWHFHYEPMYERFPFHLCATMALLIPTLIITNQYKALKFFTFWAVPAGFISFVNPSFIHDAPWSFAFIQYLIRHGFIFIMPIFFFIGQGYTFKYKDLLKSLAALAAYTVFMFFVNWILGTNYMHLGQHNPLEIPFLPKSFTAWPWSLPSFTVVGTILLHLFYLVFRLVQKRITT